ncbi:hypothetical protein K8R04_05250, partial [Candidatus Uhrbacteria bacterium]|nr:hypothetical protein [Candidatus Uhrbacteria bacterium]
NGNLVVESKLAIGTNTVAPTATLTVGGGTGNLTATPMIQINAPDDSSNPGLAIRQNNNDAYGFNFALDNAVNGDMYLQGVANNTVTNLMTFSRNNTNIGIGTTTPAAQLGVGGLLFVGANGATGMGTATSTFYGDIKINGKLDVSTIDPVYTIDGTKYATYGHSTIGIHEETLQTIQLDHKDADGKYSYTISFDDQPMGSDTWLFNQVTDFGDSWKNLVVSLTPSFDGKVFYKKIPEKHQLVIYGDEPGEVSMRLSGSRYDASKWMNLRPDQDGVKEGSHVISSKPAALPAAAASALPQE